MKRQRSMSPQEWSAMALLLFDMADSCEYSFDTANYPSSLASLPWYLVAT